MSKKVLIVEDYEDVRAMMKFIVHRHGYEVIEAADGYEAVEKARKYHPDLILMDLFMPIMDGITATQIIRKAQDCGDVPIVAISAYGDVLDKKAIEAGCNKVINKPLKFANLKPLLEMYLH